LDSLQRALAAEHAAIWGYGVVGARLAGAARGAATEAETEHRGRRDAATQLVITRGGQPVPAAPAYTLPFPVTGSAAALRLAARLEDGVAATWRAVIGATDEATLRRTALAALTDAAVRATQWRQRLSPTAPASTPFPGGAPS
jgi:hypothetical protein